MIVPETSSRRHVFAIPAGENYLDPAILVGEAQPSKKL